MKKYLTSGLTAVAVMVAGGMALAQSGHFVGTPTCTDIGTQLQCTGKVAGLGGTTFELVVSAPGRAIVECTNPAGNVAPGQTKEVTVTGSSGPLATPRNGQYVFTITSDTPTPPRGSCPNSKWTPTVVDVEFGDATIVLLEDNTVSDTATVPVN